MEVRTALTIAGSDCSGGAGIQADLKTFLDFGVYGMSVVTAVTAQTPSAVRAIHPVPVRIVRAQLQAVLELPVHAVKVGMVGSVAVIRVVLELLAGTRIPLVVDPVVFASSGTRLLDAAAVEVLRELMAVATLVTPNHAEASLVPAGVPVLETDGHGERGIVSDRFRGAERDVSIHHPRVSSRDPHGTGCTLSAAITARLAKGDELEAACRTGVDYVSALLALPAWGGPRGPLLHGRREG